MTAVMPAHLQDRILAASYREQRLSHRREFATESGKPTRSKFPGSPLTICSGAMVLTGAEYDDLMAFYATDCAEGSVSFYMAHPRNGDLRVYAFEGDGPALDHIAGDEYRVTLNLSLE